MTRSPHHGFSFIEVVVAVAIFAVLLLVIDAAFSVASRAGRRVEAAADVQQNARLALELLTREVRETSPAQIAVGGLPGTMAVVFKSARLATDASIFCLYTATRADPLYRTGCFYWPGAPLPPYANPPYAVPCDTGTGEPCGTYAPIWQRAIGYYVAGVPGARELRRTVVALGAPDAPLPDPSTLRGGQAVAAYIERFDVSLSGGVVALTLVAQVTPSAGGTVPPQGVMLTTAVKLRNER
jgi:prepilin-type N-terminal cleavage/methylation domain-containing protein